MQFVDFLQLMSGVVYLEQQAVLRAHIDSLDFRALLQRIGVIVGVLKVKDRKNCVSGVVVEHDR